MKRRLERMPILPSPGLDHPRFTRLRFIEGDTGSSGTAGTGDGEGDKDGDAGTKSAEAGTTEGGDPKGDEGGDTDWQKEAEKWKALSRKHEKREAENAEKAKKYDEQQKAGMTEAQQAEARAIAAEERADKAERELAHKDAMLKNGLDESDMQFLDGVSLEDLPEKAKALANRLKKAAPKTSTADGKPQDGSPVGGSKKADIAAIDAAIAKAISERRISDSVALKRQRQAVIEQQQNQ